jgi:hypothetical protein
MFWLIASCVVGWLIATVACIAAWELRQEVWCLRSERDAAQNHIRQLERHRAEESKTWAERFREWRAGYDDAVENWNKADNVIAAVIDLLGPRIRDCQEATRQDEPEPVAQEEPTDG